MQYYKPTAVVELLIIQNLFHADNQATHAPGD